MSNRRIFYACYAVGIAPFATDPDAYVAIRGLQTAGMNTTFNLEQVFEIGQLSIYENIENLPDVEITLEKALDGYCPAYLLATEGAVSATLVGRSNVRANIAVSIFDDTSDTASGTPLTQCTLSGLYFSQVGYTVAVDGNATESLTMVGNNKVWSTGSFTFTGFDTTHGVTSYSPLAPEGVNRRQDILMANCIWPTEIPGITSSGTNEESVVDGDTQFGAAIQSVRVSTNVGREQLLELGRRGPYFRYINFPTEVTTAIEIISKTGDEIDATEDGFDGSGNNIVNQRIHIEMDEGLVLDMGTKNKLASVTYGGGNAGQGGGNQTVTYTYSNFNDLTVQHPQDPTVALRP